MIFYLSKAVISFVVFIAAAFFGYTRYLAVNNPEKKGHLSGIINSLIIILCGLVMLFSGLNGFSNFIKALFRLFV